MLWRGPHWPPTIEALDPSAHLHRLDSHLNVFHTFWDQKLTDATNTLCEPVVQVSLPGLHQGRLREAAQVTS